jgi:acetolactate synthase-1/3 small subunit
VSDTPLASPAAPAADDERYVLVLRLLERGNALERVLGILRRRGPRFSTVNLVATEAPDTVQATITLQGTRAAAEQSAEHLRKLVDVRWATVVPAADTGDTLLLREFALLRIACHAGNRREVMEIAARFGARIVDVTESALTLEASGSSATIEQLLGLAQPFGIRELTRTGQVAI